MGEEAELMSEIRCDVDGMLRVLADACVLFGAESAEVIYDGEDVLLRLKHPTLYEESTSFQELNERVKRLHAALEKHD